METTKRSHILVNDYVKRIRKYYDKLIADAKRKIKSDKVIENSEMDIIYAVDRVVEDTLIGFFDVLDDWENKSIPELDGLSPAEYFDTLDSVESLIELVSFFMKIKNVTLPPRLTLKIKKANVSSISYIHKALKAIKPVNGQDLSEDQQAILKIVGVLSLPEFTDDLINLVEELDYTIHKEAIKGVMETLTDIGEPALDKLIQIVENTESYPDERKRTVFALSLAKIAQEHKSERIYRLLKDHFRKCNSQIKAHASGPLAIYGDRRAFTMIREYIERNKEHISKEEYWIFRRNMISLGGVPGDLDYSFIDKIDLGGA